MAEVQITCTKCKKKSPMSQMRYSKDGEDLVCQACANPGMTKPTASVGAGSAMSRSSMPAMQPRPAPVSTPAKPIRYQCTSCNYKFSRASKNEIVCPYCNRKTLRKEFQLVSDVDDMMGHLDTY